jgi:hypothetical protein
MDIPLTQRAYTLRLSGDDQSGWREALWQTHEAVNRGAKVFGDWLLTLRGGLSHTLAKAATPEGQRDRRIVLALSWLSVESKNGAPPGHYHVVGSQTKEALRAILRARSLADGEIESWITDCEPSVTAAIREDAVWVNRAKLFDEVCRDHDIALAREDALTLLWALFTDDYLVLPKVSSRDRSRSDDQARTATEGADEGGKPDNGATAAVIASGKGAGQRTRHPFSHIFSDPSRQKKGWDRQLHLREFWKDHLSRELTKESGIPLAPPSVRRQNDERSPTELHREMFSKAASRLAQIHTKRKQQEAERLERKNADQNLKSLESDSTYQPALAKLREYCEERGRETGALEKYRILPRQIAGWENVVKAWANVKDDTSAEEQRIEQAKRLQDEEADKKFGDINLFIRLAEDEYLSVWRHGDRPDSSILKTYVEGWNARFDAVSLKIAAYRHPDPYFNPIFCQFGVSRPDIAFSRLDAESSEDDRKVRMLLWDGQAARMWSLRASSKHLAAEIGSASEMPADGARVTRLTRFSRAAAPSVTSSTDKVRVAHVFDDQEVRKRKLLDPKTEERDRKKPKWNGTLKADRQALLKIGRLSAANPTKAEKLKLRLKWSLIVGIKLQPNGPWPNYILECADKTPFLRTVRNDKLKDRRDPTSGFRRRRGETFLSFQWPWEEINKPLRRRADGSFATDSKSARGDLARLGLCRLPDLRILSVDLGHRFAAACAVWQTLSRDEMLAACAAANTPAPAAEMVWIRLRDAAGKHPTTYRRLGPDTLRDGSAHPAPWARLDRQFAIKLQGEDRRARPACSDETQAVVELEKALGFTRVGDTPERIDELMAHAVRVAKLGLRRHGDCARIAFALTADHKPMPGDRKEWFAKQPDDTEERARERHQNHICFIRDALMLWHELATSARWDDPASRELWNHQILPIVKSIPVLSCPKDKKEDAWRQVWQGLQSELQRRLDEDDDITLPERKRRKTERELVREMLEPVAEQLISNSDLRKRLHALWVARWQQDDGTPARVKPGGKETRIEAAATGWHARLRWLNRWLLPRKSDRHVRKIQDVGGLSLTRIATIRSLYQLQKAFFTRLHPNGEREVAREGFADEILQKMERMREQRVKQLASRIVEAALGVGIEQPRKSGKQPKRPTERIVNPRFAACHAVVIENLTKYTPDELRTRLENRRLMDWSAGQVRKYLTEACQLHGLHLRQVSAHFTSRQDSRTGAPGLRCAEVEVQEFLNATFWKSEVARARNRLKETDASALKHHAYDSYLDDLERHCRANGSVSPKKVLIPRPGREVFVSAQGDSPAAFGLDADLNAAANIGLKALLDPDWEGRWWYVPCDAWTYIPDKNKVAGSLVFETLAPLRAPQPVAQDAAPRKRTRKQRAEQGVVRLFRDVSAQPMNAESGCTPYGDYWADVEVRVIQRLRAMYGISPQTASAGVVAGSDDVPF